MLAFQIAAVLIQPANGKFFFNAVGAFDRFGTPSTGKARSIGEVFQAQPTDPLYIVVGDAGSQVSVGKLMSNGVSHTYLFMKSVTVCSLSKK